MYLALHKDDSYGDFWFWAPEVYRVGDKYLMYYSSEEHICVAEGDSPLGPFRQKVQKPMREAKGIDNSLFMDKDGKPYLFWVNFTESGLQSWVAELEEDCSTIIEGSEKLCIATSQEWEKVWPSVNEGPFVLEHEGYYYLTYSANSYESPNYGLGYAVAEHPAGPWVKYEGNPIFQFAGGLEGVGHHAYFIDRKGNRRIAFHSHCQPGKIHPRKIHIGKYGFKEVKDGPDLLVIDEEFITPTMKIM
jgi:beta-xylosidase